MDRRPTKRRGPILLLSTSRRFRRFVLVAAIAWLYPAAYFLMLEGKVYRQIGVASATGQNLFEIEPRYRFSENWAAVGLRPANWIDRCVRRDYWETVESFGKKWKNPKSVGQRA